jgi:hypothetical protein
MVRISFLNLSNLKLPEGVRGMMYSRGAGADTLGNSHKTSSLEFCPRSVRPPQAFFSQDWAKGRPSVRQHFEGASQRAEANEPFLMRYRAILSR